MCKAVIVFLFLMLQPIYSQATLITPALSEALDENQPVDVIVYFKAKPSLSEAQGILDRDSRVQFVYNQLLKNSNSSQKKVVEALEALSLEHKSFITSNALLVRGASLNHVKLLSLLEGVLQIGLDVPSKLDFPFPKFPKKQVSKKIGVASHLKKMSVDRVWNELNVRGEGIVIAGQDTGYFWEHKSLKGKYRGFDNGQVSHDYNWKDAIESSTCSPGGAYPCDDKDHGTHTMGSMVGDDENGNQVGVAPNAKWIGCRNMKVGEGTVSSYMDCFDFFLAPYPIGGSVQENGKPEMAPHIVNNSWSCPKSEGCSGMEFYNVIQAYRAAGIMIVAAVGNSGPQCGSVGDQPGIFAGEIMVVGAWNSYKDEVAFFSGRGPSIFKKQVAPNLIAPGAPITSSVASGIDAYDDKVGTSMASPQVAGIIALLWSYRPELVGQVDATIEILQKTADPRTDGDSCEGFPGNKVPNATWGYGMVNAYRALKESEPTVESL